MYFPSNQQQNRILLCLFVCFRGLYAIIKKITVISRWSVLLYEEEKVTEESQDHGQVTEKPYQIEMRDKCNLFYVVLVRLKLTLYKVVCTGKFKSTTWTTWAPRPEEYYEHSIFSQYSIHKNIKSSILKSMPTLIASILSKSTVSLSSPSL